MNEYWQTTEEVLQANGSGENGLSQAEAERRQGEQGKNKLAEAKKKTIWQRFFEQIKDPMIIVLIGAAIVSGVFSEYADMIIILIVVLLNAILGIFQESKAEEAIEALQQMSAPYSKVKRDGTVVQIKSEDLVTGDIVLLEAGDAVPADLRIIEGHSLKIEEAALTGESVPVEKTMVLMDKTTPEEIPLGDRVNMAYMGTNVSYGRGVGVVTATAMQTEMGKIAGILAGTHSERTPLQAKLASLSKVLSIAVLAICVLIFLFSVLQAGGFSGGHIFEALLLAVSLAVAAIPEGLVVVVTVLLSIGVTKMSGRNAIIRRLTAVETLGCTQVICSDKTGTLTQNKMTVVANYGDEAGLGLAMAWCNDAKIDGEGNSIGDPTEVALLEYGKKANPQAEFVPVRVEEAPFDSQRKMMTVLFEQEGHSYRQYTKGAPDEVLGRCEYILTEGERKALTPELRERIMGENRGMAAKALRVLAAAYRDHNQIPQDISPETLEQSLTFIGLAGMIDPIRPEVKVAIEECKRAGICPVMITGDHKDTAIAIAKDLGILESEAQAISGSELSAISDEEFAKRIRDIVVYARVQPEHKVRIVNMWKQNGKITAMTGDGVNDAPALKSADIGIGMGITGTDVTKNVADMVLADDNFATIVYAVEEGRRIYENIRKAVQFLLASNLSEVVAIFLATLAGMRLFAPIHILWINLITDTFPAMALGMERAESDAMKQPPREAKESIFAGGLWIDIFYQGVIIALLTLAAFFLGNDKSHITGMTMAFLTLSMCEIFHSLNMRSRMKSIFSLQGHNLYLFGAMLLSFILTLGVIYIPGLNHVFQLTPLNSGNFFTAVALALLIIPIVELVKFFRRQISRTGTK